MSYLIILIPDKYNIPISSHLRVNVITDNYYYYYYYYYDYYYYDYYYYYYYYYCHT